MMQWKIGTVVIAFAFSACQQQERNGFSYKSEEENYVYDCVDTLKYGSDLKKANPIIKGTTGKYGSVTDAEENAYGEKMYKAGVKDSTLVLINDTVILSRLQKILSDLLSVRENPSHKKYSVHLLDKKEMNVREFGGYIYFPNYMYGEYKDNTDVLYFLIAHEIGHSERGHDKLRILEGDFEAFLKKSKSTTASLPYVRLTSTSFNKKLELEADYYGINLINQLQIDLCAVVAFWNQMARREPRDVIGEMFSSHPTSHLRAQCLQDHIQQNFGTTCTIQ